MIAQLPGPVQGMLYLLAGLVLLVLLEAACTKLTSAVRARRTRPTAPSLAPQPHDLSTALVDLDRFIQQLAISQPRAAPPPPHPSPAQSSHAQLNPGLSARAASSLAIHRPTSSRATRPGTRPVRHLGARTGFKIGVPLLALDGESAALRGLTRGRGLPYGRRAEAQCIHDPDHAAPVRGCECGFYAYLDAHGAWKTWLGDNRSFHGVMMEVGISGRFISYEQGIRFQTQTLRTIQVPPCPGAVGDYDCGRSAELFVYRPLDAEGDDGDHVSLSDPGVHRAPGWIRLRRRCLSCVPDGWGVVGFHEFATLLGLETGRVTSTAGSSGADAAALELLSEVQTVHTGWSTPP